MLLKLISTPETNVCQKITRYIDTDAVSLCEVNNIGHPHGAFCGVWEGPLNKFLHSFTMCGISYQNYRFGLVFPGVLAESDLGVDEVDAVLGAVDGFPDMHEGARVATR